MKSHCLLPFRDALKGQKFWPKNAGRDATLSILYSEKSAEKPIYVKLAMASAMCVAYCLKTKIEKWNVEIQRSNLNLKAYKRYKKAIWNYQQKYAARKTWAEMQGWERFYRFEIRLTKKTSCESVVDIILESRSEREACKKIASYFYKRHMLIRKTDESALESLNFRRFFADSGSG